MTTNRGTNSLVRDELCSYCDEPASGLNTDAFGRDPVPACPRHVDHEEAVRDAGFDVPPWIGQGITLRDVASIVQGGCASGAYMPAVTYHQARETMAEHGDDVLAYIEEQYGELPRVPEGESWSGIAVFYLSAAVDLWASGVQAQAEARDGGLA